MSHIEQDEELEGSAKDRLFGAIIFIIALILSVVVEYYRYYHKPYHAEDFTTVEITVSHVPEYVNNEEGSRLEFKGKEFNCRFWIREGLSIVNKNDELKATILSVKEGDILKITIQSNDTTNLVKLYHKMEVMGLSKNKEILFSPDQVIAENNQSFLRTVVIVGLMIIAILIFLIRKKSENSLDEP